MKDYATPEAKAHGASQAVFPDTAVLVSDHSMVMQMASFHSSETELSNDAI